MGLGGDVGHAGVEVHGADGVSDGFVLLDGGRLALVVLLAAGLLAAAVDEELGERDVVVAVAAALHVIDEAAEADEGLLHLLMAVIPLLLAGAGADVGGPAVGEFLRGVVEAKVLSLGEGVVVDGGLDEVAGGVALVIAAMFGHPVLGPPVAIGERVGGLEVAVGLLRGEDDGDPPRRAWPSCSAVRR